MEGFWYNFWNVVQGWPPFGQGLFLLIVFGGILALIRYAIFYIGVWIRGWPPEHVDLPGSDDD